ncbi:dihydrofolate reductase [Candidatus Kaiserbacteria bacterium]|nr:dihydrofolate reductase [Candidatus Kaiserbacteria bacterium]
MKHKAPIVIVVGLGKKDRALGYKNDLLWHVPADLKRFKELTMGHPVIMGQKTFESIIDILGKPFPGRTNIVATFNKDFAYEGVKTAHSLEEAVAIAEQENPAEIHIGGGGQIYQQMLPHTDRLHITWFYDEKPADTFFPEFEDDFEVEKEHPVKTYEGLSYQWIDYRRK